MTALLKRIATALGVGLAVVVAVVYSLPDDVKLKDCTQHLTRAPALVTMPNGSEHYRTVKLPLLRCATDGGTVERLPTERALSCFASVRLTSMPLTQGDDCVRGTVEPTVAVTYAGDNHDTPDPDCSDTETCADGGGFVVGDDPCACSTGADCEALAIDGGWVTAPAGVTLPEGAWRGAGCWKKVCVEIAGYSSWPLEHCPQ